MTKFDLNEFTFALLRTEPFFAALSRRITKMPTNSIPTAGVCINKNTAQFEMIYNPEFMGSLSNNHLQGVLMHEFYHIIYEHVTGRLPPEGMNIIVILLTSSQKKPVSPVKVALKNTNQAYQQSNTTSF